MLKKFQMLYFIILKTICQNIYFIKRFEINNFYMVSECYKSGTVNACHECRRWHAREYFAQTSLIDVRNKNTVKLYTKQEF